MTVLWDPQRSEVTAKLLITSSLRPEGTSRMLLGHGGYCRFNENQNEKKWKKINVQGVMNAVFSDYVQHQNVTDQKIEREKGFKPPSVQFSSI